MALSPDLESLEALLVELNRASAETILPLFLDGHGLEDKGRPGVFDPGTQADRGAEGERRLRLFRAEHGIEDKGRPGFFVPVTQADRGAEAAIRRLIAERHP